MRNVVFQGFETIKVARRRALLWAAPLAVLLAATGAQAIEINVGNYGSAPTAMPFAVALQEGFFKEFGVDITGIRNAPGGNAVRLMVAGDIAYGDGGLAEVVGGVQAGAELKIVSDNSHNAGGVSWVVMPDSPLKVPKDIKGKRMAFTAPASITESWEHWIVDKLGFKQDEVTLISAGGLAAALTLLEHGGTDVAIIDQTTLAKNQGKYRVLISGSDGTIFPALNDTIGYTTTKYATEHPEIIKGIILAHRKAVEFMTANRKKAAEDIGKEFKTDPPLVEALLNEFIDKGTIDGVLFYGLGNFNFPAMETSIKMAKLVGAIQGDVDLKKLVDESFLPDDLKTKK